MASKTPDRIIPPYVITDGSRFRLRNVDPKGAGRSSLPKEKAAEVLRETVTRLASLQARLYAENRWGVLLIIQAMDAGGKDGVIKNVLSGLDPHGCEVSSFKAPSSEELDHDFLWRTSRRLPERGRIGVFNRSYLRRGVDRPRPPEAARLPEAPPPPSRRGSGVSDSRTSTRSSVTWRATAT